MSLWYEMTLPIDSRDVDGKGVCKASALLGHLQEAATQAAELPHFASADVGRTPVFVRPTDGQPIADARYEITRADGRVEAGVTDAEGRAQSITSAQFESLDVRFTPPET